MAPHPKHPGVDVRRGRQADGTTGDVFSVRYTEPDGSKPRRTFDSLNDALDFQARRRSAKRWRPEELRQEFAGRRTLADFFVEWWEDVAMVELRRSTLSVYRYLWAAHVIERLGHLPIGDIDARRVVRFRAELLKAGVGPTSVVKTMSMMQRVFRDAVEYGEVPFNPFKAVQKPSPGPAREPRPLTPIQVERVAAHIAGRGYAMAAILVRLLAYTGMRPQEALALQWSAIRKTAILVEVANADGELDRLKNRKRARKRSRSVDLIAPLREDLAAWRLVTSAAGDDDLVFPHPDHGGLWSGDEYRAWQRRVFKPSAQDVGLASGRPYDLRHTWASLLIAEKRLSVAEVAEQLGDKTSTVLDVYTHVMRDWRDKRKVNVAAEIVKARRKTAGASVIDLHAPQRDDGEERAAAA